ncbi:hypothetical protein YC2023_124561 [Brassica napus]
MNIMNFICSIYRLSTSELINFVLNNCSSSCVDVTQIEATMSFPVAVDEISLLLQVLQRGPVRGSGRNGCTHIPRGSSGRELIRYVINVPSFGVTGSSFPESVST